MELRTTNMGLSSASESPKYRHFQLGIRTNVKEEDFVDVSGTRPLSTPEYNPELKVSKASKKPWNIVGSAAPLKATIGGSGSRTEEQSTNVESR
jgi:hypothetical protein